MLKTIKRFYYLMLDRKKKMYLESLVKNGLKMGENVAIMDGFFLDPTHCFLISIGNNCIFAPNVRLIAHDASMKRSLGYTKVGKVTIEADCFIGDSVIVLPGVTIGQGSVVGAGSVVTSNIPPESVATGNPCRVVDKKDAFLQKHEANIRLDNTPFAQLEQHRLTFHQKERMRQYLDSKKGYVK